MGAKQEATEHQETSARGVPTGKGRPTLGRRVPPAPALVLLTVLQRQDPLGAGEPEGSQAACRPLGRGAHQTLGYRSPALKRHQKGPGPVGRILSHGCQDRRRRELGQTGWACTPASRREEPSPHGHGHSSRPARHPLRAWSSSVRVQLGAGPGAQSTGGLREGRHELLASRKPHPRSGPQATRGGQLGTATPVLPRMVGRRAGGPGQTAHSPEHPSHGRQQHGAQPSLGGPASPLGAVAPS